MKVVVIGGRGKVGTYLVPQLVEKGYDVTNVSRGISKPFLPNPAWDKVTQVNLDREALEPGGHFAGEIAKLEPDILIDMICFKVESMEMISAVLKNKVKHYLACGSIWIHERITTLRCGRMRIGTQLMITGITKLLWNDILNNVQIKAGLQGQ